MRNMLEGFKKKIDISVVYVMITLFRCVGVDCDMIDLFTETFFILIMNFWIETLLDVKKCAFVTHFSPSVSWKIISVPCRGHRCNLVQKQMLLRQSLFCGK